MSFNLFRVKDKFKSTCEDLAGKDLPKVLFEGLADISKLPNDKNSVEMPTKFIILADSQNNPYCVINGRYRDRDGGEAVAIAIGLWDEERNCFSALKKTKDGKSLPLPFTVKVDKSIDKKEQAKQMNIRAETILLKIGTAQNLEGVLERYNKEARANQ